MIFEAAMIMHLAGLDMVAVSSAVVWDLTNAERSDVAKEMHKSLGYVSSSCMSSAHRIIQPLTYRIPNNASKIFKQSKIIRFASNDNCKGCLPSSGDPEPL